MMFRSIRWRLVASYMLLAGLAVGLVAGLALSLIQRHARQQEVDYLTANAQVVARQAAPLLWPRASAYSLRRLAQTSAFFGNVRVKILDAGGGIVADSGPRESVDEFVWVLPQDQAEELALDGADQPLLMSVLLSRARPVLARSDGRLPAGTTYIVVRRVDGPWGSRFVFETVQQGQPQKLAEAAVDGLPRSDRVVTHPIGDADHPLGTVEMSGAPDFGGETLATTARAFLLAGGIAMAIAGAFGLVVSRSLTSPLQALMDATSRMSAGDLSARAVVSGRDEIGRLASQFNRMAAELQRSFAELAAERDALRHFVADASHELRTPITALKMHNELAQGPARNDPIARDEFLQESQRQIERLEWITRNLLDLSRLDAGLVGLDWAQHDVCDVVRAAASPFRLVAQEKRIDLLLALPDEPLPARCDRPRLELAVSNLVDNALKFTPPGGRVEAGVSREAAVIRIWVADDGPGIDPTDLPHIFDRFYRGRSGAARGSGLGLAIVKSVVQAHGGQTRVESAPGRGSRFELDLPRPA